MNIADQSVIRVSGIEVAQDRYVSVNGPPVSVLPGWGRTMRTEEVEYHLHPAIDFELHYQVPLCVMVHTFNGGQGRIAVGGRPFDPWTAEARGSCLMGIDLQVQVVQDTPLEFVGIGIQPSLIDRFKDGALSEFCRGDEIFKTGDPALSALFGEMRRSMICEPIGTGAYLDTLTMAILTRLAEWHLDPPATETPRAETLSPSMVRRLSQHIEDRLDGPIRVSTLAEEAGLSRSHFSRAFSHSFGMSSQQYILSRRIARARGLLTDTALSATEIAMNCGFSNPSHLTTAFKSELGLTPTEYRKTLGRDR